MFNDYTPERVNTAGAGWNPPGVAAIYTAQDRATALAEGQHAIDVQPRRTFARRVLHEVEVAVPQLVDLTRPGALAAVGLTAADEADDDLHACQHVGGAAAWLERGGLLVPSARTPGKNLIIIVGSLGLYDDLVILQSEVIEARSTS